MFAALFATLALTAFAAMACALNASKSKKPKLI